MSPLEMTPEVHELIQQSVAAALDARTKPTNLSDLALIAAGGDQKLMKATFVQQDFPCTLYRQKDLRVKGGGTSFRVLTKDVRSAKEQAAAIDEGWQTAAIYPPVIEETFDEEVDAVIFGDAPVAVPPQNMPRKPGRPARATV